MNPITEQPKTSLNNPIVLSVIAYFAFVGLVIAFVLNNPKDELVSFHLRQALGIHLLFLVSGFVMVIPILGWLAGMVGALVGFILWVMGIIDAIQGRERVVPIVGKYFQEWFRGL